MRLSVRDVMNRHVISIPGSASVDEAISMLLRHHVSGMPVVDDRGKLAGMISERDLLTLLYDLETSREHIIDYATKRVVSVGEEDSLLGVTDHFMTRNIRSLPVVDKEGKLVGMVSRQDMIRFIRDVRLRIGGVLEKRRHAETATL